MVTAKLLQCSCHGVAKRASILQNGIAQLHVHSELVGRRRCFVSASITFSFDFLSLKMVSKAFQMQSLILLIASAEVRRAYAIFSPHSASVSLSTSDKPASRLAMPAGSSTVWSTASSQTARCPPTRPSAEGTTPSTRSSVRPVQGSTFPELCSLTWSRLLSVSITCI